MRTSVNQRCGTCVYFHGPVPELGQCTWLPPPVIESMIDEYINAVIGSEVAARRVSGDHYCSMWRSKADYEQPPELLIAHDPNV